MERRIRLDETLGLYLKEFRTQYKVKGKDVAEHIGKSAAYISKLEKGQIQQIDRKEFVKITNYIAKSEEGYFLFCEKIGKITDAERLQHDNFFLNFDWLERKIPVPEEVVNEIKGRMNTFGITAEELTGYINQNEDLDAEFFAEHKIDVESVEKNVWLPYQEADSIGVARSFILLEYVTERVEDFINGKIKKCEYMFPYAMLHHLLKIECKRNEKIISERVMKDCQLKAKNILLKYKFYTISIQANIVEQNNNEEDYKKLLNPYDIENGEYVSEILSAIDFLSKYDVEYTNRKLKTIVENFKECELSFAIAFMSISLVGMKELQPSLKKEFLSEVTAITQKYSDMANGSENIEKY